MSKFNPLSLLGMIANPEGVFGRKLWQGLWKGRVEDVLDPEKRGRMRVRVPAIHGDHDVKGQFSPVDNLPWAEICATDAGDDYGDFHVPYRLGDWVWVMFEGGNADYPVWMGSWYGEKEKDGHIVSEVPEECRYDRPEAYPHRRIFKSRRGHKIELSDEKGELEIKITDVKGNYIWMDTETDTLKIYWDGNKEEIITGDSILRVDGNLWERVGKDHREEIGGDHSLKLAGQEDVVVTGVMNHVASTINHNSGGNAPPVSPLPDPPDNLENRKPAFPERITDYPADDGVPRGGGQGLLDAQLPNDQGSN